MKGIPKADILLSVREFVHGDVTGGADMPGSLNSYSDFVQGIGRLGSVDLTDFGNLVTEMHERLSCNLVGLLHDRLDGTYRRRKASRDFGVNVATSTVPRATSAMNAPVPRAECMASLARAQTVVDTYRRRKSQHDSNDGVDMTTVSRATSAVNAPVPRATSILKRSNNDATLPELRKPESLPELCKPESLPKAALKSCLKRSSLQVLATLEKTLSSP